MARDMLLDMYLEDVSAFTVMTKEEEFALAHKVRAGVTAEAEGKLSSAAETAYQLAKQEMIQRNLRLVVSVARNFDNQGLPLLDIIEEGNLGLMRAVERFDPGMECRFSTYAVHWIKQAIRRSLLEKVKNIRVPAYMAELVTRWKRLNRANPGETDLENVAEVCEALKLPKENAKLVKRIIRTAQMSGGQLDIEDVGALSSFFADENAEAPEDSVSSSEDRDIIQERLEALSERESEILRYRFGLDGYPVLTLEDIGHIFSLTRERVRQIEAKSLETLRTLIPNDSVL